MNECDFCNRESDYLYPVNVGLWAICRECMEFEYGTIPRAYARQTPRPGLPDVDPNHPAYQEEEE